MAFNNATKYLSGYNSDACIECGECLLNCPVIDYSPEEAVVEIKKLRKYDTSAKSLSRCETCFACNLACKNNANPAHLILDNFNYYFDIYGVKKWGLFFQPYTEHNFRNKLQQSMNDEEKQILSSWESMEPCDEFFFPGCNIANTVYITQSKIFENADFRGGIDYCCGEMLYRTGQFERLSQNAVRIKNWIKKLGAKKMYIACTAGYAIFTNVLPQFGFDLDIEIVPFLPILLQKLESGELEISNKLNLTVTIQESCYSKLLGQEYWDIPRKILNLIGCQIEEQQHCKSNAYCCGIGGGFPVKSGYHPLKLMSASFRAIKEARDSKADALVSYCSGCLLTISAMKKMYPASMKMYHLLELVQMAIGENPARRTDRITRAIWKGAITKSLPFASIPLNIKLPDVPDIDYE